MKFDPNAHALMIQIVIHVAGALGFHCLHFEEYCFHNLFQNRPLVSSYARVEIHVKLNILLLYKHIYGLQTANATK